MVQKAITFFSVRRNFRILFFILSIFVFSFLFSHSAQASYTAQYWNIAAGSSPDFPTSSPKYTTTTDDINFNWGEFSPVYGIINANGFTTR